MTDRWTLSVTDLGPDKNFLSESSSIFRKIFRSCSRVFKDSNSVKSPRKKTSERTVQENRKKRRTEKMRTAERKEEKREGGMEGGREGEEP